MYPPLRRLVGLAILALLPAQVSMAQTPPGQGLQISPTFTEFDLDGRRFTASVNISNHQREAQQVTMRVTGLGHDLIGSPTLIEPSVMTKAIDLSVKRFELLPDQDRVVQVSGEIPPGHRGVYAAVVARYEPLQGANEDNGQLKFKSEVAASLLLRGPRPWVQTVEVVDVSIAPGPKKGPFEVYAAVRNTGNVHVRPSGEITIFKDGKRIDRVLLPGKIVIPGFARRLIGTWNPKGQLTGRYTLEAKIRDPRATGVGEVTFSGGQLDVLSGEITSVFAQDGRVIVDFRNTGTLPIDGYVQFTASREDEDVAAEELETGKVAAGKAGSVTWEPDLQPGLYVIKAQLLADDVLIDQDVTGLEVKGAGENGDGFPFWALGAGVGLLMLLAVIFLLLSRRKHASRVAVESDAEPSSESRPVRESDVAAAQAAASAAAAAATQAAEAAQQAAAALAASQRAAEGDVAERRDRSGDHASGPDRD